MQLSCPKSTLGSTWEKQFKLIKYIFDREVLGAKSEPSFPDLENTVWKVVLMFHLFIHPQALYFF